MHIVVLPAPTLVLIRLAVKNSQSSASTAFFGQGLPSALRCLLPSSTRASIRYLRQYVAHRLPLPRLKASIPDPRRCRCGTCAGVLLALRLLTFFSDDFAPCASRRLLLPGLAPTSTPALCCTCRPVHSRGPCPQPPQPSVLTHVSFLTNITPIVSQGQIHRRIFIRKYYKAIQRAWYPGSALA